MAPAPRGQKHAAPSCSGSSALGMGMGLNVNLFFPLVFNLFTYPFFLLCLYFLRKSSEALTRLLTIMLVKRKAHLNSVLLILIILIWVRIGEKWIWIRPKIEEIPTFLLQPKIKYDAQNYISLLIISLLFIYI